MTLNKHQFYPFLPFVICFYTQFLISCENSVTCINVPDSDPEQSPITDSCFLSPGLTYVTNSHDPCPRAHPRSLISRTLHCRSSSTTPSILTCSKLLSSLDPALCVLTLMSDPGLNFPLLTLLSAFLARSANVFLYHQFHSTSITFLKVQFKYYLFQKGYSDLRNKEQINPKLSSGR